MTARLRPYGFVLWRGTERQTFVFYAISEPAALAMAQEWASARGWALEEPRA